MIVDKEARLRAVIQFLDQLDPVPDVVILPEGAVPVESLEVLATWSAKTGATVLAGTHTPKQTPGARRKYAAMGIKQQSLRRLFKQQCTNALPVLMSGRAKLIPKSLPSVFERSNVSVPDPALPSLSSEELPSAMGRFLPLICSEALRTHNVRGSYDLVFICSYDPKPDQFGEYIKYEVRNRKVVAYCNDGRFGGSGVAAVRDQRAPDWLNDAFGRGLPPGDALLVVDVDLDTTAVEVGTAAPNQAMRLVVLAAIVGARDPEADITRQVSEIREIPEPAARAHELEKLLQTSKDMNDLHRRRLEQLRGLDAEGVASDGWWTCLGSDCIVSDQTSLRELEAQLAAACARQLNDLRVLEFSSRDPEIAPLLVSYLTECQRRGGSATRVPQVSAARETRVTVDREREIRELHEFLDGDTLWVLEITGLPQIGKSAMIEKALAQYGRQQEIFRIPLLRTSSIDYVIYSILQRAPDGARPPYQDPVGVIESASFAQALRGIGMAILERADALLERGSWRDELAPKVLAALAEQARLAGTKLTIETSRELPIDLLDAGIRRRIRVTGLDRSRVDAGVSIFETQLRRVGLDPSDISLRDKELVVNRLGGHPAAIAFAADTAFDYGLIALLRELGQLKGFYLNYVDRLVIRLDLSSEEKRILQLLTLVRGPIPREVILASADFAASSDIRNLIALGAIDVTPQDQLEIAGILRDYFSVVDVPENLRMAFHSAAADALEITLKKEPKNLSVAVEAEFHSNMIGRTVRVLTSLVDATLASAEEFFHTQRYDNAMHLLTPLLRGRPSVTVLRLAAQVEARRNFLGKAVEYASEAFRRDPKDTWLLAHLVKIALTQHQVEFAEQIIDLADRAGIEDEQIHIARGRILLRRDNMEAAENAFERARQLTQRNPWPFFFLGKIYFRLGRLDDAIGILHDGERFAYDARSRDRIAIRAIKTLLGTVYLFTEHIDLAEQYITSVLEENPDGAEEQRAHAALMVAQGKIKDAHEAIELLRRVRSRGEARCKQQLFVGQFYEAIGDLHHAAQEYRVAYRIDLGNVFVMMKLANALLRLARAAYRESDESYQSYANECADLVRSIFKYDRENPRATELMHSLRDDFGIAV